MQSISEINKIKEEKPEKKEKKEKKSKKIVVSPLLIPLLNEKRPKKKLGRPFLIDRNSHEFICKYCEKTMKSSGPNSYYVWRHYLTNKCESNREKYFEMMPEEKEKFNDKMSKILLI